MPNFPVQRESIKLKAGLRIVILLTETRRVIRRNVGVCDADGRDIFGCVSGRPVKLWG